MAVSLPHEHALLARVALRVDDALARLGGRGHAERLELLESVACELGGLAHEDYARIAGTSPLSLDGLRAREEALTIAEMVSVLPYEPALALCTLAQPPLDSHSQRKAGAFYTDYRLANLIGARIAPMLPDGGAILDPSSGTGSLLVATTIAVRDRRGDVPAFLANQVYAADLDSLAIRGTLLSLSSLTDDPNAVRSLHSHLRVMDSLVQGPAAWPQVPGGFAAVLGNPPWEKLKVTRHEFLRERGHQRHYGADYDESPHDDDLLAARRAVREYGSKLDAWYDRSGTGERDLYRLFVDLSLQLCADEGHLGMIVPASLIRTDGAFSLRKELFDNSGEIEVIVVDNGARFFAIDSRFKFVVLLASKTAPRKHRQSHSLRISYGKGKDGRVALASSAVVDRRALAALDPGLRIPEVRSDAEWRIFQAMFEHGVLPGTAPWRMRFRREVDMTKERPLFTPQPSDPSLPVIEGRMVHQYRCGCKQYESGTGRAAVWRPVVPGAPLRPQYWLATDLIPKGARSSVDRTRAGFCDVTGQTNERTMLAASIPAGVVCGNKVPTVTFSEDEQENAVLTHLWVSIVNSLVFDWMLRRVVTTSLNYFILRGLPLPRVSMTDPMTGRILASYDGIMRVLADSGSWGKRQALEVARHRADIDVAVLQAYGLGVEELSIVLDDFPQLDKAQPALPGEKKSTVTSDFLMLRAMAAEVREGSDAHLELERRVALALQQGAVPYVPNEHSAVLLSNTKE